MEKELISEHRNELLLFDDFYVQKTIVRLWQIVFCLFEALSSIKSLKIELWALKSIERFAKKKRSFVNII